MGTGIQQVLPKRCLSGMMRQGHPGKQGINAYRRQMATLGHAMAYIGHAAVVITVCVLHPGRMRGFRLAGHFCTMG
jgi:hypothetical protein